MGLKDGEPWSPTDLARPRTVSSPTSWLASGQARSRPGPPAGPRGWPSTTSSSGSRRSWAQTPSTQELSSEKEFDLIKKKIVKHKLTKNINQITEEVKQSQEVALKDGIIKTYDDHEDSVYAAEWSCADPWTFASLSYDGRLVINQVPRSVKFRILNLV